MNNYDDEQSEDGELAQSPIRDEMDFSLSDDEHDSLVIKPPQAVIQPSYRRSHKKSAKERHKEASHKEKKHLYRDRDKLDKTKLARNVVEREDLTKEFYREKPYYREAYREKEVYRDKEVYREKELYRERDVYREKDVYRERDHHREREYRETMNYKDPSRSREGFREKDIHKERELQRDREILAKDRQRYELERRQRGGDIERIENRLRSLADDGSIAHTNEKENRDKGDKELEDLRSRLLNKRISKELQEAKKKSEYLDKSSKSDRQFLLDKHQEERRKKLLEAEREMEKRKNESRNELEARREERRRRGKKRSVSPDNDVIIIKKNKNLSPDVDDNYVTVSDASDVELKSESAESDQDNEEDQNSKTDSDEASSVETDSDDSKTDDKEGEEEQEEEEEEETHQSEEDNETRRSRERSRSPVLVRTVNQESPLPGTSPNSHSRSKSRSRSRSHSFSPPHTSENGKAVEEEIHNEEETKLLEEKIKNLPPYFPALQGCRSVEEFHCLNRIEEGTYGVVYRARDRTTEEIVALKRLKMEKEKEGFPITSLREINTLLKGQHPNIVTVREIVVGSNMDKIFIVMDYVEHDLKSLMETMRGKKQVFLPGEVKCLMRQLLSAVHHLHDNWILHRDLKTSNLLLSHKGILKVGDFGLAREYGSPLRPYTPVVVTLWYRAPELLLCAKHYSTHIDMWSVGCIFAEFVTMHPLFPGKSEIDQLNKIFKDLGTPSESVWAGFSQLPAVQKMKFAEVPAGGLRARAGPDLLSDLGLALLQAFLAYDPAKRISADVALDHPYFGEQPLAVEPGMFPTWPAKSEGRRAPAPAPAPAAEPRPPPGGTHTHTHQPSDDGFHVRALNMAPGFSLKF